MRCDWNHSVLEPPTMQTNNNSKWVITKGFVEDKLVREPVEEVTTSRGSNVGDNVASELLGIQVLTKKRETIHLVFKTFPFDDPEQLNYVTTCRIFRRETAVYQSIIPSLEKLLGKAGQPVTLPVPKYFASYNDDENDFLSLEDLRPAGYRMLDKFVGLGHLETLKVMEELGRFHALTYQLLRYEGEKYFEGEGEVGMLAGSGWTKGTANWELMIKLFGGSSVVGIEFITKEDPELAQKVQDAFGNLEQAGKLMKSIAMKTDSVYFPCIIHGDLWTNNILIKHDLNGTPVDLKFIDFQQSRRGNIFEDLQYFLLTSTTTADRRQFLGQWLETYYLSFTKTLARIQCPNPPNFTRGFFVGEMWNCFLSGYAYMHFAIPFQLGTFTPIEGEIEEQLPESITSSGPPPTIDEYSAALHAKFRKWMARSPAARNRLLELTREFVDYGLL